MKHKYLFILLLLLTLNFSAQAQDRLGNATKTEQIEGLQIYPNPTTNNRVFIVTDNANPKEIDVFDLLGKKVFSTTSNSTAKELNLSQLKSGVYLIRIKEKETTVTRKLVLK